MKLVIKEDTSNLNNYKSKFNKMFNSKCSNKELSGLIAKAANDDTLTYNEYEQLVDWAYKEYDKRFNNNG